MLMFFSLRTRKWKRTATYDENYYFLLNSGGLSVSIDDSIYWPPDDKSHILGLNLVSGQLKKISLENAISGYNEVDIFRFWMLKQHDDCTSWEKIFSFNPGDSRLIYLFEMGKCLLGEAPKELKLLDPCKVALRECEENTIIWQGSKRNFPSFTVGIGYVESLISPFGTTKYDEDEDDHEIKE